MDEKKTTVRQCERCGKDHKDLIFKPFERSTCCSMTHWAMCPELNEPILMTFSYLPFNEIDP